ncbi:MAG: hypothetical protein ABIP69_03845 [Ferruginibacter sp.]
MLKFEKKYMRYLSSIILLLVLISCNKDKFSDEPQLTFIKFDRTQASNLELGNEVPPHIYFELTDGNGDIGLIPGKDTSKIYIKNLLTNKVDSSLLFPDLRTAGTKNFKGELKISLRSIMSGRDLPTSARPYQDTIYFEIYVTDFAKNKSNVIVTDKPFVYSTLP